MVDGNAPNKGLIEEVAKILKGETWESVHQLTTYRYRTKGGHQTVEIDVRHIAEIGWMLTAVDRERRLGASGNPHEDTALPQRRDLAALDRLSRTCGVSPQSLVRRMVEPGHTTESPARRASQRQAGTGDPLADPTSAYPREMPSLLMKVAELAGDDGLGGNALAVALKLSAALVHDLLGDADQSPILDLVGSED